MACVLPHQRPGQLAFGAFVQGGQLELAQRAGRVASNEASRAETPGSGSGRRVASTSNRGRREPVPPAPRSAAAKSGRPSAGPPGQARSGPWPRRRATTARTAANVARWRPSGLRRAQPGGFGAGGQAHHVGQQGERGRSGPPNTAFIARSKAVPTSSSPSSGATPTQADRSCWYRP